MVPEPLLLLLETGPLLAGATVGAQLELLSSTAALQVRAHMVIHQYVRLLVYNHVL